MVRSTFYRIDSEVRISGVDPGWVAFARANGASDLSPEVVVGRPLGQFVAGPAAQLLRGVGCEVSALGVATFYRDWITGFVIDEQDAAEAAAIEALGLKVKVTDTIMRDAEASERVARAALELAG